MVCAKGKGQVDVLGVCRGRLKLKIEMNALFEMPALSPYWGKPNVR